MKRSTKYRKAYSVYAEKYAQMMPIANTKQFSLRGSRLDKSKPLDGPVVGKEYGLYFNLNAMYNGVFGQVRHSAQEFEKVKSFMFPSQKEIDLCGKAKGIPKDQDKANVMFSGSVYSFKRDDKGNPNGSTARVTGYARSALLEDVVFSINDTSRKRIVRDCNRNPCCYVQGFYLRRLMAGEIYNTNLDWEQQKYRSQLEREGWRQIIFNPFRFQHYQYLEPIINPHTGGTTYKAMPAYTAEYAVLMSQYRSPEEINRGARPYLILAKNVNEDWQEKATWNTRNTIFGRIR